MSIKQSLEPLLAKLPPLDEKNRYYYLGGVLLLVFILDYLLIMQPQLKTLMTLNPKISVMAKDYAKAKEDIQKFQEYKTQLEKMRFEKDIVHNTIPLKEEIPTILENISTLANSCGVKINQIVPLKDSEKVVMENEDGQYFSALVLVDARGGYHNLGQFFNHIETDPVFMSIAGFDFSANSEDSVNHSGRVTINAFYLERSSGEAKPKAEKAKKKTSGDKKGNKKDSKKK